MFIGQRLQDRVEFLGGQAVAQRLGEKQPQDRTVAGVGALVDRRRLLLQPAAQAQRRDLDAGEEAARRPRGGRALLNICVD